jgi:hypothetical protein
MALVRKLTQRARIKSGGHSQRRRRRCVSWTSRSPTRSTQAHRRGGSAGGYAILVCFCRFFSSCFRCTGKAVLQHCMYADTNKHSHWISRGTVMGFLWTKQRQKIGGSTSLNSLWRNSLTTVCPTTSI